MGKKKRIRKAAVIVAEMALEVDIWRQQHARDPSQAIRLHLTRFEEKLADALTEYIKEKGWDPR